MKAILILAHGSRENGTEATLEEIVGYVRESIAGIEIVEAYMQFRDRSLALALEDLASRGFGEILVIPYFLFDGVHIREDVPSEIEAFCSKHPLVSVRLGKTLGADRRLADVVRDRALELIGQ
jgi:sirohydrochlorin ferrochelatase